MARRSTFRRTVLRRATLAAVGLLWLGIGTACQDDVVTILDADLRRGDAASLTSDAGVSSDTDETADTGDAEPDAAE